MIEKIKKRIYLNINQIINKNGTSNLNNVYAQHVVEVDVVLIFDSVGLKLRPVACTHAGCFSPL